MASVKYSNVPDSVPGPNSLSGLSGKPALTCFQLVIVPCAPGSHIFFSSATVRLVAQLFLGLTTTARPSYATGSSMNCICLSAHAFTSAGVIGREAFDMSVSPAQNLRNPPPVPEMPTGTRTFGAHLLNSSDAAAVTG